jgi:hypothetical protein
MPVPQHICPHLPKRSALNKYPYTNISKFLDKEESKREMEEYREE